MTRPSMQFYFGDWRKNANLRRCTPAARGCWIDIMGVLHDSDEYGVARWPLRELARAAGVQLRYARELSSKGVLKGSDCGQDGYNFAPAHAGRVGESVTLLPKCSGPCWFSSKMLRDEYVRHHRGLATRFSSKTTGSDTPTQPVGSRVGVAPMGGFGSGLYASSLRALDLRSALGSFSDCKSEASTQLSRVRVRGADEEAEQRRQTAEACAAVMVTAGMPASIVTSTHPFLLEAIGQGATPGMFEHPAKRAMKPGITDPVAYACGVVIGQLRNAKRGREQEPAAEPERKPERRGDGPLSFGALLKRAVGGVP